jgi:hypothetical protein
MADAHQQLLRPQQFLAAINSDYLRCQTFHTDDTSNGVLQFPHAITFGFPLPSRGAVVYGPDGKPWFTRKVVFSSIGSNTTASLELYNMDNTLLATCIEQQTETGVRFQCINAGIDGGEARSIFLIEKAPTKERLYFLSMSRTGEVVQCSGILEYWHKKSFAFTLPPSEQPRMSCSKPPITITTNQATVQYTSALTNIYCALLSIDSVALMSKDHNVVAGTRGIQVPT